MSYNHQKIVEAVHKCLLANPRVTLAVVAAGLGVTRQTVRRALLEQRGMTYRDAQRQSLLKRVADLDEGGPPSSAKEKSFILGYKSPASLTRLIKRARGPS